MTLIVEKKEGVAVIKLNRPKALNALNVELTNTLISELVAIEKDPEVGCTVITGSNKVFAAGADIKEMQNKSFDEIFSEDYFAQWHAFIELKKPKIAAVAGYALGGGCELAMMCDTIFAADTAHFGQPEIKLGVIPGIGGSQRLTQLVGKAKAMDMVLTGRLMNAVEAERAGLVARVVPEERLLEEAIEAATLIAGYGRIATIAAKEAVDRALEVSLQEGLLFERRLFHSLFATHDQKEGMQAFIEKRTANFNRN